MSTKSRIPIPLTDEQHKAIVEAAKRLGLSVSAFIRMAAIKAAGAADEG